MEARDVSEYFDALTAEAVVEFISNLDLEEAHKFRGLIAKATEAAASDWARIKTGLRMGTQVGHQLARWIELQSYAEYRKEIVQDDAMADEALAGGPRHEGLRSDPADDGRSQLLGRMHVQLELFWLSDNFKLQRLVERVHKYQEFHTVRRLQKI